MGVMIWSVWPSFSGTGYLVAWDAGGHLLKAYYFAHHLLPLGHLSGWFPVWHGGFDLFQFYPPLLYYLLGPMTLLMEPELALRLFTAVLWISLAPATYYFLRSFRVQPTLAAIGTSFFLALNASFGLGLGALYGVGLLPNGLGFVLAILALGRLKRDLNWSGRSPKQFVLTGLVFALLVLSHTFSAYWWLAASLILLVSELFIRKGEGRALLKRYAFIVGIGLLLSAFWWLPLIVNLSQMGPTGDIQQSPRGEIFKQLILAKDSGGALTIILAVVGLGYLAVRKSYAILGFIVGLAIFSLLLSLNTINQYLPFSSVVSSSQHIRFEAFFDWLVIVTGVFGVVAVWQLLKKIPLPFVPTTALVGLAVLVFSLVTFPRLEHNRGFVAVADNQATDGLPKLADFLNANLRPGEFILTEFNWSSRFDFGSPHFVNQRLPFLSYKTWDLDGNFPEGTVAAQKPVLIASVLDNTRYLATQQEYLKSRGIRYIVTTQASSRANLSGEPWLRLVWSPAPDGDIRAGLHENVYGVFELTSYDNAFGLPPAAAEQLSNVSFEDPGKYTLTFRQLVTLPASTSTALSYHPWLKANADGNKIATSADSESRLQLAGDARDVKRLTITYEPGLVSRLAKVVSVLAVLMIALFLARPALGQRLLTRAKRARRPERRRR